MKRSLALLGLLLAGAGAASAQDVAFETLARGAHAPYQPPSEHVIRSQAELQAAGITLPPGAQVDFGQDMVLAVFQGTQNTGGYSIEITKIERKQMMVILPVPGPPPSYYLEVQVERRTPPPGSIVTMALTSPFHIVKLPRTTERVDFVGASPAFTSVERYVRNQVGMSRVTVGADAAVRIVSGQQPYHVNILDGTATAFELRALTDALRAADFEAIPADLTPSSFPLGARLFTLEVTGAVDHSVDGVVGFEGQYAGRLGQINAALDAIVTRVQTPPAPFTILNFDLTKQPGSRGASLFLFRDGRATVQRTLPNALIAPVQGQATAAELAAVEAAVRGARLASIPAQLPVPIHIMAATTFSVDVASDDPALVGKTAGEPGYLQQYEARLRPLIDACSAIIDRIAPDAPQGDEAKGVVRVSSLGVSLVETPQHSYRLSGALAATVRKFVGRTVKVAGRALGDITTGTGHVITRFEATDLLFPVQRTDAPVQVQPGATLRFYVEGQPVRRLSGPAASVLRAFPGRSHQVDGFVFPNLNVQEVDELYAEAVAGKAKQFSSLTRNGQWVGYVSPNQRIEVLAVSGNYALVRAGTRTGWLRKSRIEAGEVPVPLHTPAATPGLTGSVPGQ